MPGRQPLLLENHLAECFGKASVQFIIIHKERAINNFNRNHQSIINYNDIVNGFNNLLLEYIVLHSISFNIVHIKVLGVLSQGLSFFNIKFHRVQRMVVAFVDYK